MTERIAKHTSTLLTEPRSIRFVVQRQSFEVSLEKDGLLFLLITVRCADGNFEVQGRITLGQTLHIGCYPSDLDKVEPHAYLDLSPLVAGEGHLCRIDFETEGLRVFCDQVEIELE